MTNKRHKQFILAVDKSYVVDTLLIQPGFEPVTLNSFIYGLAGGPDLASHLVLREREHLEKNKNYLQILNYVVLKQNLQQPGIDREGQFAKIRREDFFSTYYRKKGVGEDRLADKMSIGWGGHTDRNMVTWNPAGAIDFQRTVRTNMVMELNQECRFRFNGTNYEYSAEDLVDYDTVFKGFIYDPSDDVGQHHLALVWEVTVPDSITIESREDEHKLGAMCNRSELMEQKKSRADLYENWSNILIDEICKDSWDYLGVPKHERQFHTPEAKERRCAAIDWAQKNPPVEATEAQVASLGNTYYVPAETKDDISVWSAKLHNKLKAFGASNDVIDSLIKRTLPDGDLVELRNYNVDELHITSAGIFAPAAVDLANTHYLPAEK
jgi:predicted NUDIX family phosphoesterase